MRLFIGIPIPSDYRDMLREVQNNWASRLVSCVKWVKPELMHITLKFLGDVEDSNIPAIHAAMHKASRNSFDMQGGRGGIFPPKGAPQTVWLGFRHGVMESAECVRLLDQELIKAGFAGEKRPFVPHLTVTRVKSRVRRDDWDGLLQALGKDWPVFSVNRIILWQSILHTTGPEYRAVCDVGLKEEEEKN